MKEKKKLVFPTPTTKAGQGQYNYLQAFTAEPVKTGQASGCQQSTEQGVVSQS